MEWPTRPCLPGTVPVLMSKTPSPRNPLGPRQIGMLGHLPCWGQKHVTVIHQRAARQLSAGCLVGTQVTFRWIHSSPTSHGGWWARGARVTWGGQAESMEIQCKHQVCGGEVGSGNYHHWGRGLWIVTCAQTSGSFCFLLCTCWQRAVLPFKISTTSFSAHVNACVRAEPRTQAGSGRG